MRHTTKALFALTGIVLSHAAFAAEVEHYIQDAQHALRVGQPQVAAIELSNALTLEPNNSQLHLLLGQAELVQENYGAAQVAFLQARAFGARWSEWALPLAKIYYHEGRYQALLNEISLLDPQAITKAQRADLHNLRGQAALGVYNIELAEREFSAALDIKPEHKDARVGLARVALFRGEVGEAKARVGQIVDDLGDSRDATMLKAEFAERQKRLTDAERHYRNLLKDSPINANYKAKLADNLIQQKRWYDAFPYLEDLGAKRRQNPKLQFYYAAQLAERGDMDNALRALNDESVKRMPEASLLKAKLYIKIGNALEALPLLDQAAKNTKDKTEIYRLTAVSHLLFDDPERAAKVLSHAPKGVDFSTEILRAAALSRLGDRDDVVKAYQAAARLFPKDAELNHKLWLGHFNPDSASESTRCGLCHDVAPFYAQDFEILAAIEQGKPKKALELSEQALDSTGTFAAHYGYYVALKANDQDDKATAFLDELRDRYPDVTVLEHARYRELAASHEKAQHISSAIQFLGKILADEPEDLPANLEVIRLYLVENETERAVDRANKLAKLYPKEPQVLRLQGGIQLMTNDFSDAAKTFEQLVALTPNDPEAYLYLAKAQRKAGALAQAATSVRHALSMQSSPALSTYMVQYELAEKLGDEPTRKIALKEIKHRFPKSSVPYRLEGEYHMSEGDYNSAAESFEKALEMQPSNQLITALFEARKAQGNREGALDLLKRWAKRHPNDPVIQRALASAYLDNGEKRKALENFEAMIKSHPNDVESLSQLANIYAETAPQQAVLLAKRAYSRDPRNARVLDTLGWSMVKNGDLESGRIYLQQALEKSPQDPGLQYHLAYTEFRFGDYDRAKKHLERAFEHPEFQQKGPALLLQQEISRARM